MKKKKWKRFRHKAVVFLARPFFDLCIRLKYGFRPRPFKEGKGRPYLILFNHQTAADQFFVGLSFPDPVYYVASEDLFSNGLISALLRWAVAPIPIKKQAFDPNAVVNCIRVAREGGTIALAPEGNRTYSGETCHMRETVVPLARKLGLPVALYRIEGGYGVHPRWSDVVRRGAMSAGVSRVIEPREYSELTDESFFELIRSGLYVDESRPCAKPGEGKQGKGKPGEGTPGEGKQGKGKMSESDAFPVYNSPRRAERLERVFYTCPVCGLSPFESAGNMIKCKKCALEVLYLPDKRLSSSSPAFTFESVGEWYSYQQEYLNSLDVTKISGKALFEDVATLSEVIPYRKKVRLCKGAKISLFADRIEAAGAGFSAVYGFSELSSASVLGRNKLNIYHGGRIIQFKGGKGFNALKYLNFYYKFKNFKEGKNGKFLGL